ncbi:MAG: aspartate carbamoyltransferase regulatory subunit [Candidatus Omnitrophota bacterium]|nr:MAG: aspartate carbamoyltransferase regulatory subunit [Candidatus Omnitrophota bacterium]
MAQDKVQRVSAIKNGTVIDHIPPEATFKVLQILNLTNESITVGNNLSSKKMGLKGLVKISNKILTKEELNKIAVIAPHASVCAIKDYKVKNKFQLKLPEILENIITCFNPKCITRKEEVPTKFYVMKKRPLKIRCHYCERIFKKSEILIK